MSYMLAEREGILFAKETSIDEWHPRVVANWYSLTLSKDELALYVPDINKKLGCVLTPLFNPPTVWEDEQRWKYYITSGISGERIPVCTEITSIPEPAQRGRKYLLQWNKGAWHKKTSKGLVKLAS